MSRERSQPRRPQRSVIAVVIWLFDTKLKILKPNVSNDEKLLSCRYNEERK